jgi:hypothetical protein
MQISLALQSKDWTAADLALAAVYHSDVPNADRRVVELDAEVKEARGQSAARGEDIVRTTLNDTYPSRDRPTRC